MEENSKENFLITYSWMDDLGLRPAAVRVYAVIYSFTEHGQTWHGSCTTLAKYARSTRCYVNCILEELTERGLIRRVREERKGVSFPEYVAVRPGETDAAGAPRCSQIEQGMFENRTEVVQKSNRGCSKIEHNNKEDNKDNNKVINIIPSSGGLTASVSEANDVNTCEGKQGEANGLCLNKEDRHDGPAETRPGKNRVGNAAFEAEFDALWELYPRKQGRSEALAAYIRARRSGTAGEAVRSGLEAYNRALADGGTEPRFIKQGGNWFAGRCWEDEPNPSTAESGMENAREENAREKNARGENARGENARGENARGNGRAYYPPAYAARRYGIPRALNYPQHIYTKEELTAMGISLGEELYEDEK